MPLFFIFHPLIGNCMTYYFIAFKYKSIGTYRYMISGDLLSHAI